MAGACPGRRHPGRQGPPPVPLDPPLQPAARPRPARPGGCWWAAAKRRRVAFSACHAPSDTPLIGLVRVAGARGAVEEGSAGQGRGRAGPLRGPQVAGWYPHITLALLAHAFLAVTRARATSPERTRGDADHLSGGLGLLPLTVPRSGGCWSRWSGPPRSGPAWCWPGPGGVAATRPPPDAHTTSDANHTCVSEGRSGPGCRIGLCFEHIGVGDDR
jgi:hypothetical protein